jgi:hypothetical protein
VNNEMSSKGSGMSTSGRPATNTDIRATRAWYADGFVWVELDDGRQLGFPPSQFRRLQGATPELLAKVRVEARGRALRWEELDEDLSVDGLVHAWNKSPANKEVDS